MRALALAFAAVVVGMVTCQPHDLLASDATTMGPPPLVDVMSSTGPAVPDSSAPPMVPDNSASPMVPDSSAPPMVPDNSAPPMVPDSSAPPMVPDSTAPPMVIDTSAAAPVVTDTSAAPDQTTAPASTAPPAVTDAPVTDAPSTAPPATEAPTTTHVPPEFYYPTLDEIVDRFRGLAQSEFFNDLDNADQLFVLELLSGGEVGKIREVMDRAGYERLLGFIYSMPFKYLDNTMQFILASIQRENDMIAAASS